MSEINTWSTTASSNNSAAPNGWPEGMQFEDVNDAAREMMAALKRWRDDTNGSLTAGGSSGAYTLAPNRTIAAYAAGLEFVFKANHTSASSPTLNVSSLGTVALQSFSGTAQNLISGRWYRVVHTGSVFVVIDAFPEIGLNQEWTATQNYATSEKTGSSLAINCNTEPLVQWTLTADSTLNNFTNIAKGRYGKLVIIQGGSGGYTVTPNSNIKGSFPTLTTAVGSYDVIYWSCTNGTNVSIEGYSLNVNA